MIELIEECQNDILVGVFMFNAFELVIAFFISAITTLLITPFVKKIAFILEAVDKPDNKRKYHTGIKASMGGLAIFVGASFGFFYLQPEHIHMTAMIIGALIMLVTGMIDDIYDLKPSYKLIGQITAAIVVVSSGLVIDKLTVPFFGTVYLEEAGYFISIVWIIGVSNAINLIDGLDGLAAGVSAIGLSSLLVIGLMDYRLVVVYLTIILIGSCVGFLYHNFHPAKIFMGDTGALFLGYSIAVISMEGLFKNVALFSFIIPIIVIAIPVLDTVMAIIRRLIKRQSIATPDKKHIHYQLMEMGYSHKTTVLIIYGFSALFGILAITFNSATMLTSLVVLVVAIIAIQLIAELAGFAIHGQQPLIGGFRKLISSRKMNR